MNQTMDVATFTRYANQIDDQSKTTVKTVLLAEALTDAGDDLAPATRFFQGQIFPQWDERKVKMGPSLMRRAIAKATGADEDAVEDAAADVGDTGAAIEELGISEKAKQQVLFADKLSLVDVYERFEAIAEMSGSGSQQRKIDAMADIFLRLEESEISKTVAAPPSDEAADDAEQATLEEAINGGNGSSTVTITAEEQAKYLIRLVLDEMRIGIGQGTVRDAIAEAFDVDKDDVQRAIMVSADIGRTGEAARDNGSDGLQNMSMTVGRPVEAMLAVTGEIDDSVEEWGDAVGEIKYDGARLQLHKDGDDVHLFTRGLEDVTDSLPDVVDIVQEEVDADEAILDSEVVAYDEDGEPMEFTKIMERLGRKYDIDEKQDEITVNVRVFDVLYHDGDVLMEEPLTKRFNTVESIAESLAAGHIRSDDPKEIREFEAKALSSGNEGIMLKRPDAQYSPGKRGQDWRKVKPEVETLDCVVIGGEWGEGKRSRVEHPETGEEVQTIGSYEIGVLNDDGVPQSIGKVATGFTDAQLVEMTERFEDLITDEDGKQLTFDHEVVFEVGYEELQPSPEYGSGFGLRFPRFLGVRTDKRVEDADTIERVKNLHEKQN